MRRFAAGIEYNGAQFKGWQRQPHAPSVQEAVESALSQVADHAINVVAAGRTDTGVHATGQIFHFDSPAQRNPYQWLRGCNTMMASAARLIWVQRVDPAFSARFSARQRHYRYIILKRNVAPGVFAGMVSWCAQDLDVDAMRSGAQHLLGKHDFSAFRAASCQSRNPVRDMRQLVINAHERWLWLDFYADGFLHHMVRNVVGSLLEVGLGGRDPDWILDVLAGGDRTRAGITASPDGLYLCGVDYPDDFALPRAPPPPTFW